MKKIIFRCCEFPENIQEELEFEDNITEKEIEEKYKEWFWNKFQSNNFCCHFSK